MTTEKEYSFKSTFYYLIVDSKKSTAYHSYLNTEISSGMLSLKEINDLLKINPEKDIYYRVQIGAFSNPLDSNIISKIYDVNKSVDVDYSEGNYIYTVGTFRNYYEAKSYQKACGIDGAFLVLFYMGDRINKNMALEILNH